MALFIKQNLVLRKIIKAIEEDWKQDILQMGSYYKPYINFFHENG